MRTQIHTGEECWRVSNGATTVLIGCRSRSGAKVFAGRRLGLSGPLRCDVIRRADAGGEMIHEAEFDNSDHLFGSEA